MKSDWPEFITELKEKNEIVEVIGSYIKLDRKGYNYWACCPFHHEKTPSFSINAADKYYHCFGCGVSGDVIGFVKEYENVDFRTAVQILATRAKMEIPAYDDHAAEEAVKRKQKKDRLLSLMKDTARFYLNNLYSGKADGHLDYLEQRKISPSLRKKFGLGASLDYQSLPSFLLAKGYTKEECLESGACAESNGRLLDAQGGRLIIPIINHMDEVIAFGGRIIVQSDRAKYKNTRDTVLFDKSKNLYNINQIKKQKRAGGISSLIMVEGYMDVISLYQAGFENVVASMGTSLTKEQARLCKRYTDNVFISYDGDFAGQKANLRGLDIMKAEGVKVRVVPLPEGLDPDDVVKKFGQDGYRKCLDEAMPLIDFRIHAAKQKYDLSRTDEKRDFVKDALAIVREAESNTEREELLKRISAEADVSYTALVRDLDVKPIATSKEVKPQPKEDSSNGNRKAERFVLAACLFSKPYAQDCDLNELDFEDEVLQKIADYIERERARGGVRPSGLFDEISSSEKELSEVLNLDYGENLDGEQAEQFFADSLKAMKYKALSEQIALFRNAYSAAETQEERAEILTKLDKLTKQLKNYR